MENPPDLRTPAWLLVGLTGSSPGVLELTGGRLAFRTDERLLFDAPVGEIRATFPWYYFGGGAKVTAGRNTYRLSFVRPNGGADVPAQLAARLDLAGALGAAATGAAVVTAGRKIFDVHRGRRAGRAWKRIL